MTPTENYIYQFFTWTCVAASIVLKLPQLLTVLRTKSVRGLSTPGMMLELWSFTAMLAYQFAQRMPLLQYIDYVFLMFQEIPLFLLVLHYNGHFNFYFMIYTAIFSAVFGSVAAGVSTDAFNAVLINANTPISAFAKLTQLFAIFREKSAGSVSATTWSLAAYTCFARIITLKLENVNDMSLLVLYVVAGTLNCAIVLACFFYGSGKPASGASAKVAAAPVKEKKSTSASQSSTSGRDSSPEPSVVTRAATRRSPRKAD